jgi:hypothetical protein
MQVELEEPGVVLVRRLATSPGLQLYSSACASQSVLQEVVGVVERVQLTMEPLVNLGVVLEP